jgi:hypothetical protein
MATAFVTAELILPLGKAAIFFDIGQESARPGLA